LSRSPYPCLLLPLLLLLSTLALPARADDATDAQATLETTVEQALAILGNGQLDPGARREKVTALAEQRFDFELMARFVVARDWKRFTDTQRAEFTAEFKKHLAATYGEQLEAYSEERVEFGTARVERNGDVTGATRVIGGAAGDGVDIAYRMRRRDGEWYVIDVIIAGVSMVQNFRSQIREVLQNSTPDELIERLRKKNEARSMAARTAAPLALGA
jgi:phospholipid transport system substrate-binding protein